MKILYASDVHGDLKSLEKFRDYSKDNADVVVCSGDLVGFTLKEKQMGELAALTKVLLKLRESKKIPDSLEVMAEKLLGMDKDDCPKVLSNAAQRYQRLQKLVKAKAKKQYGNIKEIFDSFNTTVFTIPGNWDIKHFCDTPLLQNSLHGKKIPELNGITFGGYGGSYEQMLGILPLDLQIPFNQIQVYEILKKLDPDIAIVHCPPWRILDRGFKEGVIKKEDSSKQEVMVEVHPGSEMIRLYAAEEQPCLLLVGHIHESIGVQDYFKTAVVNPGNLGKYEFNQERNSENFGTFMEILTEDKHPYFKEAKLRNIEDPKKIILNYVLTNKGVKKEK